MLVRSHSDEGRILHRAYSIQIDEEEVSLE